MAAPWEEEERTQAREETPRTPPHAMPPAPAGLVSQALTPITSYPETYAAMNREALEQMEHGVGQLASSPTGGLGETAWEKIKGVGNVGLGALGFLYSPISAGLRSVVGNPLQGATGIPREYSEFAAGLALPGVGLRPVGVRPPRPGPSRDVAEAATRQGVNIPRAAATENIPIQATAGAVKEMPIVGTPLVEASRESQRGMEAVARRTVGEYGSGEATVAGQRASEGIQNWITGRSREINERIYGAVDNLVDPNYTAPLNNTQAEVAQIMARRANARISGVSRAVDEVTDALTSPMNYDGVKTLRTYIGEMTPQEMVAKGITKQEAEAIYRGLSRDLRDIVQGAGGQPALAAWERANAVAQQIFQRRSDLAKIVGAAGDATPESVVQRIIGMAGSKKGADYATLVQARRAMGPDAWDDVASAIVNQMGHTKPGRDWSGAIFKASWDAMTPASRRLLFGSTGRPDSMQAIQDLVTMSSAYDRLAKFANPSGTSRAVTLFGMASAAWAAPLETLASAVGSNVMARFLASPVTARWGTRWGVAYTNAMRNPTPQRMGLLADEANRLSGVISSQLGVTIPPSAFMPGAANASKAPPIDLPEVEVSPTHHQHGGEVPGAQRPELPYIGEVELPPADVVPSPGPGVPARIVVRPPLYPEPEPTPQATPGAPQGVVQGVAQPEYPQVTPLDVAKMLVPPIGNLKSLATGQPAPPMGNFPATPGKIPEVGDPRWLSALGEAAAIGAGFVGPPLKAGAAAVGKFAPAIFAGPLAANANHAMLRQAEKLATEGMSHPDILKKTGWWLGSPDGKPRWEISDRLAKLKPQPRMPNVDENGNIVPVPLGEYVHHPELYKAYPGIENQVKVGALPLEWEVRGIKGSYDPDTRTILVPWRGDPKQNLSTILHELSHVVQEGPEQFAVGANMYEPHVQRLAEQLLPELQHKAQQAVDQLKAYRDAWIGKQPPMTPAAAEGWFNVDHPEAKQAFDYYQRLLNDPDWALQKAAHLVYLRHAGEAEARNVQKRQSMGTGVRRITPPSETQDVPNAQQIVMGAEQGTMRFRQDQPPGAPPPMGHNQPPPQYALPPPANYPAALGRKLKRSPDVAAPKTQATELAPGIFVGDVTLPQWIKRTETILSPEEITQARNWYKEALPTYERYFGKEKGSAMLGAWLMANQNTSPSGAQLNAVRTLEQYLNKTGEFSTQKQGGLAHKKLMEYWDAILSDDPSKLKQAGTGQKIYDFVDSAAGKQTRTFYGDDPRAGAPAVADIHSYRDMGYVDEALHNWIKETYGNKVAKRITRDTRSFQGQREAPYEWAGDKMRRFADELNQMGYMGGNWTPAELQAVGWTSMSKMTGRKAETSGQAIEANIRHLGYELDPGAGAPLLQRHPGWTALPHEEKAAVTNEILPQVVDFVAGLTGAQEFARVPGIGGWRSYTNPSMASRLIASPEVAEDFADAIGYITEQTKIMGYRWFPSGDKLGIYMYGQSLGDQKKVARLWSDLQQQFPDLASGFSPSRRADGTPGIEVILNSGNEEATRRLHEEMLPALQQRIRERELGDIDVGGFRAKEQSREHDWQADPGGATYLERLRSRYGPDVSERLELFKREQFEPALADAIRRAGERGAVRARSLEQAQREAATASAGRVPLAGLPQEPIRLGDKLYIPGPSALVHDIAERYMQEAGLPYNPIKTFQPVNVPRAEAIARAFDEMQHAPNDPAVRASYEAMARETKAQYEALRDSGIKFEFIKEGQADPYAKNPRMAIYDFNHNKHLWVYPTSSGFGDVNPDLAAMTNPLLAPSGVIIEGRNVPYNDLFRIVHDVYGHIKDGNGFRAAGEENAWRSHSSMYSDAARPAMTSETRGQNSWVNYGPHGAKNRKASAADTVYSEQKVGLLPWWAIEEGRADPGLWQHDIPRRARGGSLARGGAVKHKAIKASVDYSRGMPAAHCGICKFYNDHACAKVRGYINPRFWCELFQKEASDAARRRDRSLALG